MIARKTKRYWVYILESLKDHRTYVGYTKDLEVRLTKHNSGQVKSTKHRRPLIILYKEMFQTKGEAKEKELWWKSRGGRQELKKLFY
ncbi:MAG: hypothetical protein A3B31_01360 [Candidatus Komeilibacteria bacterium RIFCSPLOWO2_01_FULL_53_11]|uniref:GIY-YIG domain-containing protein n=1 Tax=Candidatus Komeilibacteria bacterium RIFCSPLOWO2_01_FULL_53_11 TaxID=1798552 RepID=A0A1G2BQ52_9BACT|nr:MAG: hypothetical protein A3B31_01360 [Candidatus Komeilibacteria bacterium RIFCSPLOWO2_01_FULL_53_11]